MCVGPRGYAGEGGERKLVHRHLLLSTTSRGYAGARLPSTCRSGTRTPPGSPRSRRGPRSSASGGCTRCSTRSAIRSAPIPRSTSSARTGSRRRRGRSPRCSETEGLRVGCYTSPHVSGWGERLDVDDEASNGGGPRARAAERGRRDAVRGADGGGAVGVRRSWGGCRGRRGRASAGRLDATNVLDARVVLLTNVSLEHTECSATRAMRSPARSSRSPARRDRRTRRAEWATLVLTTMCGSAEPARRRRRSSAARSRARSRSRSPGASNGAAETEIWDGAHTPEGDRLAPRADPRPRAGSSSARCSPTRTSTRCSSALPPSRRGSSPRSLRSARRFPQPSSPAGRGRYVSHVVALEDPVAAVREAGTLGDAVLVTGSLYLLADLHGARWE